MAIDMTPDEFRAQLETLLDEEDWFEPIAIIRNGERRIFVLPAVVFHSMHRESRRAYRIEDLPDEAKKLLREAKVAEPGGNPSEGTKDEPA